MESRRSALTHVAPNAGTHAGLWLDKYLERQTETGQDDTEARGAKARLIRQISDVVKVPAGYREAYVRHETAATNDARVSCGTATALGRIVIGLGAKGALEAGLHLDHTWGVPVLPGPALKGLASATAHHILEDASWRKPTDATPTPGSSHAALFGTTDESGLVTFLDAWWIPGPGDAQPIHLDVMTVHHPDYYQHAGDEGVPPPADTDSPNPVAFASVGGTFFVAVEAREPEWREAAMEILRIGLSELGIGAKTNAGYGRLRLDFETATEKAVVAATMRQARLDEARLRVRSLSAGNASQVVPTLLASFANASADERLALARLIEQKLERKFIKDRKDKPWAAELLAILSGERG